MVIKIIPWIIISEAMPVRLGAKTKIFDRMKCLLPSHSRDPEALIEE